MNDMGSHNTAHEPTAAHSQAPRRTLRWWLGRSLRVSWFFLSGLLLIVCLGLAQRLGWLQDGSSAASTPQGAGDSIIYTCSMDPQIRQTEPGRCPICGMQLVPATKSVADLDEIAVHIAPAQRRLANIETEEVRERPVSDTIRTIGAIEIDESRQATIASYIDGRVERLFADYTGVEVALGDHLAVVYSPQLYAAQVEYLEATRTLRTTSSATLDSVRAAQGKLVANSRQRLIELGMTEQQLAELDASNEAKSRLTIFAPFGGTVIEKLAEEGKYISAGEPIYRIANLSTVWLMLELYPEDASRIRFGQVVQAELTSLPGKSFTGRVAFIDPQVDARRRTVGVRVEFDNQQGNLRPGDYAQATINVPIGSRGDVYDESLAGKWISPMHPQIIRDAPGDCPICGMELVPTSRYGYVDEPVPQPSSVVIPRSALLMAGDHSVVYVETEPGRFELRNVTLGRILRDEAVVVDGLRPGERVATSGNFLIDSQMQLAGKPSLIDPTRHMPSREPEFRNTPLEFASFDVTTVEGDTGQQLEALYTAYFEIQRALASDQLPVGPTVKSLVDRATELARNEALVPDIRQQLDLIRTNAEHLHHGTIEQARFQFKPISHAVLRLATRVRGQAATQPFYHFFCPMVKQGEGDWLQSERMLSNPYYGSQMLRCGELVHTIPAEDMSHTPASQSPDDDSRRSATIEGAN